MSDAETDVATTTGKLFGGQLVLRQFDMGHRAGTDAVLLATAAGLGAGQRFVDVGAGTGAVGLWLGHAVPDGRGVLLESHSATAELARRNAADNGLAARVEVACVDLFDKIACRAAGLEQTADLVVTNPPFYTAEAVRSSPDAGKRRAHVLQAAGPDPHGAWLRRCADLLAPKGRLLAIHRADVVPALIEGLRGRVGGLRLLPIHPIAGRPATRVLLGGTAGSRAPMILLPGIVLHTDGGAFTPEAAALHRGERLAFWPADHARRDVPPEQD